jgi:hypothetical protein
MERSTLKKRNEEMEMNVLMREQDDDDDDLSWVVLDRRKDPPEIRLRIHTTHPINLNIFPQLDNSSIFSFSLCAFFQICEKDA